MDNNPYSDNYKKASEYLRLSLSLLSRRAIPPSPLNIQMAYEYASGRNKALTTALNEILVQQEEPSEESLWALYNRYFVQDDEDLAKMRQELRRIISNLQDALGDSGGQLSSYVNVLSCFTDSLTEVESLRKELEEVKEKSRTDALTGIFNRNAFDEALADAVRTALAQKSTFCLLLADIDLFKKFNDTYGHLVGDKVLRFVASTLKGCVKGMDTAARFGGEEFAVILPQTALLGAGSVSEQIRKAISSGELKVKSKGGTYGKITISIGIAQFNPGDEPDDLIERADRVLYLAKERGRNRVEKAT